MLRAASEGALLWLLCKKVIICCRAVKCHDCDWCLLILDSSRGKEGQRGKKTTSHTEFIYRLCRRCTAEECSYTVEMDVVLFRADWVHQRQQHDAEVVSQISVGKWLYSFSLSCSSDLEALSTEHCASLEIIISKKVTKKSTHPYKVSIRDTLAFDV